jgi:hypothetical protein
MTKTEGNSGGNRRQPQAKEDNQSSINKSPEQPEEGNKARGGGTMEISSSITEGNSTGASVVTGPTGASGAATMTGGMNTTASNMRTAPNVTNKDNEGTTKEEKMEGLMNPREWPPLSATNQGRPTTTVESIDHQAQVSDDKKKHRQKKKHNKATYPIFQSRLMPVLAPVSEKGKKTDSTTRDKGKKINSNNNSNNNPTMVQPQMVALVPPWAPTKRDNPMANSMAMAPAPVPVSLNRTENNSKNSMAMASEVGVKMSTLALAPE